MVQQNLDEPYCSLKIPIEEVILPLFK